MIDHVVLPVSGFGRSRAFYEAALAPLGYEVIMQTGAGRAGLGAGRPDFWLQQVEAQPTPIHVAPIHVALRAESRAEVDAFHAAALAAGGTDKGSPGLREHYHPTYYGAFVLDPDGHNVEAVTHVPS